MSLIVMLLCSCATQTKSIPEPKAPSVITDSPICVSCGFLLSPAELSQLRGSAASGDSQAAFRVALHYGSDNNHQEQLRWLNIAADMNHPVAQYNLWFILKDSMDCASREEAVRRLRQAAANNQAEALQALVNVNKVALGCPSPGA